MRLIEVRTLIDGGRTAEEVARWIAEFVAPARDTLDLALYDVRVPGPAGDIIAGALRSAVRGAVGGRARRGHGRLGRPARLVHAGTRAGAVAADRVGSRRRPDTGADRLAGADGGRRGRDARRGRRGGAHGRGGRVGRLAGGERLPAVARQPALALEGPGPGTGAHRADTVHDYMHAKVAVADEWVFLGSFNLSRSGELNAENVLERRDAALADRLAGFIDDIRGRYPAIRVPEEL